MSLKNLMRGAAHSIVARSARLREGSDVLIICGNHNRTFAESLMLECLLGHAYPHMWVFEESIVKRAKTVAEDIEAELPQHTRSLLENSDIVIWLTQFENPKTAATDLGAAVCAYWDRVYDVVKGKPLLLVNLFSAKAVESLGIEYQRFLETFTEAVTLDYVRVKKTGSAIAELLENRKSIHVTDPNGSDLKFSIENRRVGAETGTLEDCYSTGRECEVEIPAGEVYVAPVETSAAGTLVSDEVRDFDVEGLTMQFEKGRITNLQARRGRASFQKFLKNAHGDKDRIAEFGIGTNHGMKPRPTGLRVYDEKALGTVHIAIGHNVHLGGNSEASMHIDFVLYRPTIRADGTVIIKEGKVTRQLP